MVLSEDSIPTMKEGKLDTNGNPSPPSSRIPVKVDKAKSSAESTSKMMKTVANCQKLLQQPGKSSFLSLIPRPALNRQQLLQPRMKSNALSVKPRPIQDFQEPSFVQELEVINEERSPEQNSAEDSFTALAPKLSSKRSCAAKFSDCSSVSRKDSLPRHVSSIKLGTDKKLSAPYLEVLHQHFNIGSSESTQVCHQGISAASVSDTESKMNAPNPSPINKLSSVPKEESFDRIEVDSTKFTKRTESHELEVITKNNCYSPETTSPITSAATILNKNQSEQKVRKCNQPSFKREIKRSSTEVPIQGSATITSTTTYNLSTNASHHLPAIPEDQPIEFKSQTIRSSKICIIQPEASTNGNKPEPEQERHPSFQYMSDIVPKKVENSNSNDSSNTSSLYLSKPEHRVRAYSKPPPIQQAQAGKRRYEDMFYRRKAFIEKGPAALRSSSKDMYMVPMMAISETETAFPLPNENPVVITKVVTKTVSLVEGEEECHSKPKEKVNQICDANCTCHKPTDKPSPSAIKSSSTSPAKKTTPKKVTIVDQPDLPKSHENDDKIDKSDDENSNYDERTERRSNSPRSPRNESPSRSGSYQRLRPKKSKVSKLLLPGHGNRTEKLRVRSPCINSSTEMVEESQVKDKVLSFDKNCKKCKKLKNLLTQCEDTVRYLTQLLSYKERELQSTNDTESGPKETRDDSTNTCKFQTIMATTSFLEKLMQNSTLQPSTTTPRAEARPNPEEKATTPCAFPKFDVDEFIRKFFRHILFTEDYSNLNESKPFDHLQLFRAAIAARDCMTQVLKQKLKDGHNILKRKHEILLAMKSSSEEPLDESVYLQLLDSYRRFVRFIYYYLKLGLKDVETFEQTYIPQHRPSSSTSGEKIKYSHETKMTIDGVQYSGVFIPIEKL